MLMLGFGLGELRLERRARPKRQRLFELNRSHNLLFARHPVVGNASDRVAATSLARPATGLQWLVVRKAVAVGPLQAHGRAGPQRSSHRLMPR